MAAAPPGGVDSFAELPFMRAPPPAPSSRERDATIRLFGRDFSNDQHQAAQAGEGGSNAVAPGGERKFECHYCCRNFPTSQALGGHQNAHKRERQHARRAHLEASFAAAYLPPAAHHLYGALFGYGAAALPPPAPAHYPPAALWAGAVPGMYGGGQWRIQRGGGGWGGSSPPYWLQLH